MFLRVGYAVTPWCAFGNVDSGKNNHNGNFLKQL